MSDSKKWSESTRPPKVVGIGLDYSLVRMRSEARGPAIALEVFLNKEDRQGNNYLSMEWHEATSWGEHVSPNGVDCRIQIGFGSQQLIIEGRNLHKGYKDGDASTISVLSGLSQHRVEALWVWGRHYKDVDDSMGCIMSVKLEPQISERAVYSVAVAG